MTITYMKEGSPKSWDKSLRRYEITWPDGKKEIWKDITARACLTKYENMDPMGNRLQIREITGKELKLQKMEKKNTLNFLTKKEFPNT